MYIRDSNNGMGCANVLYSMHYIMEYIYIYITHHICYIGRCFQQSHVFHHLWRISFSLRRYCILIQCVVGVVI